ncbi:MAG: CAP domain-containing protein [Cocleimonas sp.]
MKYCKLVLMALLSFAVVACSSVQQKPPLESEPQSNQEQQLPDNRDVVIPPPQNSDEHSHAGIPNHTHEHYQQRPPERPPLSNKQRFEGMLNAHNRVRAKHRLKPLKWSNKLQHYSQQWANQLGRGSHCSIKHRSQTPYGENLYRSGAVRWSDGRREVSPVTIRQVVKAWTDEERWYDYKRNRCQSGKKCGHYTQAVWRDTTEVGCAMKVCADKSQTWVCSYNPPGNYTGKRPY